MIYNLGSLNIDHVYRVAAFARPGETTPVLHYDKLPGGKGLNQSTALARAGACVAHAGKVGPDGLFLVETLRGYGVDTGRVRTDGTVTGHACIQVDAGGQNSIIWFGGANREVDAAFVREALADAAPGDWLLMQNEVSALKDQLAFAAERGLTAVLNPSPITPELLQMDLSPASWLLLNETEGNDLTGETEPERIVAALLARYPAMHVVLTLGEEGSLYADAERRIRVPAVPVQAVDTTAAGDTFTGFFIAGVSGGLPLEDALRRASCAAALAVSRPGACISIPTAAEVDAF